MENKKRKKTDYQWSELGVLVRLLYPNIKNKELLISKKDTIKNDSRVSWNHFDDYWSDLVSASDISVSRYLSNIPVNKINLNFIKIYLEGKNVTDEKIKLMNSKLNKRQKKADIYVEYKEDHWLGISIKKSGKCTLTNYSVEKFCAEVALDLAPEVAHDIKKFRIQMLKDNFGKDYKKNYERRLINDYLKNKEIPY